MPDREYIFEAMRNQRLLHLTSRGSFFNFPTSKGGIRPNTSEGLLPIPDNIIPVIFTVGQSNANGRANALRLAMTTWATNPDKCHIYYKTNFDNTDDGSFRNLSLGVNTFEAGGSTQVFSYDGLLAQMLRDATGKDVYVINCGEGGVGLGPDGAQRDWYPSSNEAFTRSVDYMFLPAIADLQALYPDGEIVVFKTYHLGETDAQSDTKRDNYLTNLIAFDAAVSAKSPLLADAPWLINKLYFYQGDVTNATNAAREVVINGHIQTFVTQNADRSYLVDFSDWPKKVDLTADQKGGFSPIANDDNHNSYLQHIAIAERHYQNIINHFRWRSPDISPFLSNNNFDPSTISPGGLRCQMNASTMTVSATPGANLNSVSVISDEVSGYSFTPGGTASRLKYQQRKGCIWFPGSSRAIGNTAMGTDLFGTGVWSIGFWIKPYINGAFSIFLDTSAYAGDRSRLWLIVLGGNIFDAILQVGATIKRARSAAAFFSSVDNQAGENEMVHVAVTCDGSFMKLYKNGQLVTLSASANQDGNLSGLTASNYVNGTNPPTIGATYDGSTFTQTFNGVLRELLIQPVCWTPEQIESIMLN